MQSHAAICTHGPLLVWADSLPRVGPGPLGRRWQLSDVIARAGQLTLELKLLINKSHISCLHFCFRSTWATSPRPALEISPSD